MLATGLCGSGAAQTAFNTSVRDLVDEVKSGSAASPQLPAKPAPAALPPAAQKPAQDYNALILEVVRSMPEGGGYSIRPDAFSALRDSIENQNGTLAVDTSASMPSFCSAATYQVFLKVIAKLQKQGLALDNETVDSLLVRNQPDGEGVWGRWNANAAGIARLFHELGLGRNFSSYEEAKPGDFLKIFWTDKIGKQERGHSVIYLGSFTENGEEYIRFWSANTPGGFGVKAKEKSSGIRTVFSRLERPEALTGIGNMPLTDPYSASLLSKASTKQEMFQKVGIK